MSKANYGKVETSLEAGMLSMRAKQLASLAEFYQKPSKGAKFLRQQREHLERLTLLKELRYDLVRIYKLNRTAYRAFKVKRKDIEMWMEQVDDLSDEMWESIELTIQQIQEFKINNLLIPKPDEDKAIIEKERIEQQRKRFNIRNNWIPLH